MLRYLRSSKSTPYLLLILLYFFAVFLRFYNLDKHLFFGFEQGRDFIAARDISNFKDTVLVGPKTDIPGVFHGAYYYYILAVLLQITGGSPVAVSFILILLSSSSIIPLYYLGKAVTQKISSGFIFSILFTISYHYISYARWLSNVSPAVPLGGAAYYFIYRYASKHKVIDLYLFVFLAFFAAQFEIILTLWFVFFLAILFLMKAIVFPATKHVLGIIGTVFLLYLPFLIFNIRNNWITLTSVKSYLTEGSSSGSHLFSSLQQYLFLHVEQFQVHVISIPFWAATLTIVISVIYILTKYKTMKENEKTFLKLSAIWVVMSLPVLFFPKSLSLVQLYIETGFGMIGIFGLILSVLLREKYGKFVALCIGVLLSINLYNSFFYLKTNQKVFYITIQDGHNIEDQKRVLNFIHTDSQGKPYHFKAYTIPYYQEEGWQYLHEYFLDDTTGIEYSTIYLVIEKPVDPFWHEKWVGEFGPNVLDSTYNFDYFTLEKRLKTTTQK